MPEAASENAANAMSKSGTMPGASRSPPTNGAAKTRTFLTHCRGRIVFTTPRTTPNGVRVGATRSAGTSMSVIAGTSWR